LRRLREIIKQKGSQSIVYLDETGFDGHAYRQYGWAQQGQKVYGDRSGKRWQRTSLLLAQVGIKRFAPMLYAGTCNTELFNTWLEVFLVPELTTGQTVVMDNASIHKNKRTQEIVEKAGCQLLYLPPYSPDFNPIEKTFGVLKRIRQFMPQNTSIDQLIKDFL